MENLASYLGKIFILFEKIISYTVIDPKVEF